MCFCCKKTASLLYFAWLFCTLGKNIMFLSVFQVFVILKKIHKSDERTLSVKENNFMNYFYVFYFLTFWVIPFLAKQFNFVVFTKFHEKHLFRAVLALCFWKISGKTEKTLFLNLLKWDIASTLFWEPCHG